MSLRPLATSAALLLALAAVSPADARPGTATKYRPANLFGGYKDKQVEPGVWRIDARSNGIAEPGFAQNMAVYRAAEVIRAAGFTHIQVIKQKGEVTSMGFSRASMSHAGESMSLWVRGANTDALPSDCRAKDPAQCFTIPVARAMERTRPLLTFPSDGS